MASEPLTLDSSPGLTVYPVVMNGSGEYLDFSDDTFKAGGSVVTPSITVEEQAELNGQQSRYVASLDLSKVDKSLTVSEYYIRWLRQVGASKSLTNDTNVSDTVPIKVAASAIDPHLELDITPGFKKDAIPQVATFTVTLKVNGTRESFSNISGTPTCTLSVYEEGSGTEHFNISSLSVDAQGDFYGTKSTPGYNDDRVYEVTATVSPLVAKDTFLAVG